MKQQQSSGDPRRFPEELLQRASHLKLTVRSLHLEIHAAFWDEKFSCLKLKQEHLNTCELHQLLSGFMFSSLSITTVSFRSEVSASFLFIYNNG